MKRIYACFAIVAALLATAFYSSFQVQRFADDISTELDCAIEAIRNSDLPTARQALARGADRCDRMREKMNHLLRIRYINVELAKPVDDFFSDGVGNTAFVIDVGRIAVQLKVKAAGAQVAERNRRRRILQHIGIFRRNIQKCLPHQCNVAVIIDADCNFRPSHAVGISHVNQAAGQNVRVGNDNAGLVARFQSRRTHADLFDNAFLTVDDNPVAEFYRPFK